MKLLSLFLAISFAGFSEAHAVDQRWSLVYNQKYMTSVDKGCFVSGNLKRATQALNDFSWMEYQGSGYFPFTRVRTEKTNLPTCGSVVFGDDTTTGLWAVSQEGFWKGVRSEISKVVTWKNLMKVKTSFDFIRYRLAFDPLSETVAWIGNDDRQYGMTSNDLILFNGKTGQVSERMKIGTGREGMSAILPMPGKSEFLIASVDWCLNVKGYDTSGLVSKDYSQINQWFKDNKKCLGYSHTWQWKVDLGFDSASGRHLLHFSEDDDYSPDIKTGFIYSLDLLNDQVIDTRPAN